MTYRELYLQAKGLLAAAGVDPPGPDAITLMTAFFGIDRPGLALRGGERPAQKSEAAFLEAVGQRAARRPLQYILGRWDFMGLSLKVGEGVLIPREDTAVLVEAAAGRLNAFPAPAGLDLCAGTGAVALGLCSLLPEASVTCLELSDSAFPYLEQNLAAYPQYHIQAKRGDILLPETAEAFSPASLDFIVSNPPYVKKEELPALQPEVQREPAFALDGGPDGLAFYRAIVSLWLPLVKPGGLLALEIGEEQGRAVSALLKAHGLEHVKVLPDWAGLDRCVAGTLPAA